MSRIGLLTDSTAKTQALACRQAIRVRCPLSLGDGAMETAFRDHHRDILFFIIGIALRSDETPLTRDAYGDTNVLSGFFSSG